MPAADLTASRIAKARFFASSWFCSRLPVESCSRDHHLAAGLRLGGDLVDLRLGVGRQVGLAGVEVELHDADDHAAGATAAAGAGATAGRAGPPSSPRQAPTPPLGCLGRLHRVEGEQRHDHQRDDWLMILISGFTAGRPCPCTDRRPCPPVTAGLVRIGALAAEVAVPRCTSSRCPTRHAGGHRDRDEEARDDRAHQEAAERLRAEREDRRPPAPAPAAATARSSP